MDRAISKIDEFLRMPKRKGCVIGGTDVTGVCANGGVPEPDARGQALYSIDPAKPPFPTPLNVPFQIEAGIHTSIPMSKSLVGVNVAAMRQNAGILVKT